MLAGRSASLVLVWIVVVTVPLLDAADAAGQISYFTGVVTGDAGRAIGGAVVTAKSRRLFRSIEVTTSDEGRFRFSGLESGLWEFTVHKDGYIPVGVSATISQVFPKFLRFSLEPVPPIPADHSLAEWSPDEPQAQLSRGQEYLDEGDFDLAIDLFEILLARVPRLTTLHLQIGHTYRAKGDLDLALSAYRKVPDDSPAAAARAIDTIELEMRSEP